MNCADGALEKLDSGAWTVTHSIYCLKLKAPCHLKCFEPGKIVLLEVSMALPAQHQEWLPLAPTPVWTEGGAHCLSLSK